jgi:hypothetical protein
MMIHIHNAPVRASISAIGCELSQCIYTVSLAIVSSLVYRQRGHKGVSARETATVNTSPCSYRMLAYRTVTPSRPPGSRAGKNTIPPTLVVILNNRAQSLRFCLFDH